MSERRLGVADVTALVAQVPGEDLVLVGGQALNFWADRYRAGAPELAAFEPFTSADVDFVGDLATARHCGEAWRGEVRPAAADDHTSPQTAVVVVPGAEPLVIDFLGAVNGIPDLAVLRRMAPSVPLVGRDGAIRVMHPFHCFGGQLDNAYGALNRRGGPEGERHRMRTTLAIAVLRCFLMELLGNDPKMAGKVAEQVIERATGRNAIRAFHLDDIDVLVSVPAGDPRWPAAFRDKRWPQAVAFVTKKRGVPAHAAR